MRRLLAVFGAIGLVAIAVVVRATIDGDDHGGGDGSGRPTSTLTIVCISELGPVCAALDADDPKISVRIESAQTTLDALVSSGFDPAAASLDLWLTVDPYPAQVAEQRFRALLEPSTGEPSPVLARSPMALVGWNDRLAPLTSACGGSVTWRCLGDHASDPWSSIGGQELWGVVRPGQANPSRTATGLLTLSQATASWFGTADFASNDFRDPAFQAWFTKLERGVPSYPTPPRTPLDDMLSLGPSTFDVAGSPEAIAAPAVDRSRYNGDLALLYPDPMVTADVVLVPVAGSRHADEVDTVAPSRALRTALLDAGWRVPDAALPALADPDVVLPDSNGLPRAGVVEALRALWLEVTR